ncbi:hypothetical protein BJ944DRAFT_173090 [Cunninghamella echinulata]|nr:hypothetical protein BJ944DRAFT_173090 [Cunninghamella echinulata]
MTELKTSTSSTTREANERTQLLETTTTSYSTREVEQTNERVIDIPSDHEPTIPFDQLKHHIQDVLIFGKKVSSSSSSSSSTTSGHRQVSRSNSNSNRSVNHQQQDTVNEEYPSSRSIVKDKEEKDRSTDQSFKKRDVLAGVLKFATDQYIEHQGLSEQVDAIHQNPHIDTASKTPSSSSSSQHRQKQTLPPPSGPLPLLQHQPQEDTSVNDVWDMAKNASVCAVLGLLSERRQGKISITDDTDATLQRLALSTLEHGMKQTSAKDMLRQEMLFKPLLGDKSAVQWAAENNCEIFLNDDNVKSVIKKSWLYGDIEWRTNPNHPFHVWNSGSNDYTSLNQSGWSSAFTKQFISSYLARWASPRYQCLIGLFVAIIYLGFHLATLSNDEYMSAYIFPYEYFYYTLVVSDLLLESWKFLSHPIQNLRQPSTYLIIPTVLLLAGSFALRVLAFTTEELFETFHYLYISFVLLSIATPFMIFRMFIWIDDLWWPIYKVNYIIHHCLVQSIWVFFFAFIGFLGFLIGFAATQRDDITPWLMIRRLILSVLYTPDAGETLYYQAPGASGLLAIYLFVMIFIVAALFTASFISTILSFTSNGSSFEKLHQQMEAKRATRVSRFGVFIPNVAIELIVGSVVWLAKKIRPSSKLTWLEQFRQILWFIIYSPIILIVALYDFIYYLIFDRKKEEA